MPHIPLVDLKAQYATIKDEIDQAIADVITNTSFVGGPLLAEFETKFAAYQRTRYAVGVANGTAALMLVLKALDIGPGDEVITSAHTFMATVEAIELVGAKTVLVDIEPRTYNIDPAAIEAAITPATKAIIPVHIYGQMAQMDRIMALAEQHSLLVIEDAAQAHGAEYQGRRAGEWGHAACFSFYPGKNLGAYGEGGAVVTNDRALAERITRLRDHGSATKYHHDEIGYNERLHTLQAAILIKKLAHLDDWNELRRQRAARYCETLSSIPGITLPVADRQARHIFHIYCIRVPGDRDQVKQQLNDQGIGVGIHYPIPVHLQPAMAQYGWQRGDFPHTEAAAGSILSLPIYPEITTAQVDAVVAALREVVAVPQ